MRRSIDAEVSPVEREDGPGPLAFAHANQRCVGEVHRKNAVHYYVPQMLRLFHGASANSNAHPALEAYKRAYPEESARALALAQRLERGLGGPESRGPHVQRQGR